MLYCGVSSPTTPTKEVIKVFKFLLPRILAVLIAYLLAIFVVMPAIDRILPDSWNQLEVVWAKLDQTEPNTNLLLVDHVLHPGHLPDGHYTVANVFMHGRAVLIRHQPGPYRDFAYYVQNCDSGHKLQPGDNFTVWHRQII